MLDHQDLGFGITLIDTGYMRTQMTACYMIEQGDQLVFIDTGVNANVPGLLELAQDRGFGLKQIAYIIPTHVHLDHAGGVGQLMQRCPNAQLIIHPRGARHMIDPSQLIAGVKAVYGEDQFTAYYGELPPVDAKRVIQANDNFCLDFNGRNLCFIDTPGHARHHFCVIDEASQGVFTGDCFGISYREFDTAQGPIGFPTTTPVQFDPPALHKTIDRILSYRLDRVYITHYGCLTQLDTLAAQLHRDIDAYVAMVNKLSGRSVADMEEALLPELLDYMSGHIQQHIGSQVVPDLQALLMTDAKLNTQGLVHWKITHSS